MEKHVLTFPSLWNYKKYYTYARYLWEYVKWRDFLSLRASIAYMVLHKSIDRSWVGVSALGKFRIRPNTSDFQYINYTYEVALREYLKKQAPRLHYFVDIGACIGEYSIWLAKSGVQSIAFEPVNYPALEENIRLNGLENKVMVYQCGLGAKKERVQFHVTSVNTGASHVDREATGGNIPIDTLDHVFKNFKVKDTENIIIKLDVEGMEKEVIEGAGSFIQRTKNLQVIYEKWNSENNEVEDALKHYGNFVFEPIDTLNAVARKTA